MIRVNLLKDRREPVDGLEAAIAATGPSAFINRREIVLGTLFLALGAGILYLNSVVTAADETDLPLRAAASEAIGPPPTEQQPGSVEPARRETAVAPELTLAQRQEPAAMPPAGTPVASPSRAQPPGPWDSSGENPSLAKAAPSAAPESSAIPTPSRPAPPSVMEATAPPSRLSVSKPIRGELSSLEISRSSATLRILATIGSQPPYKMFRLNSPNRVVVDLSGVTLALPAGQRQLTPSHPLVERVRIAQFQVSPPQVRMVFDVSAFPEISIQPAPEGLSFQLAAPAP